MTGLCLCGQVGLRVNEIELDGTSFFIGIMIIMDRVSHAPMHTRTLPTDHCGPPEHLRPQTTTDLLRRFMCRILCVPGEAQVGGGGCVPPLAQVDGHHATQAGQRQQASELRLPQAGEHTSPVYLDSITAVRRQHYLYT